MKALEPGEFDRLLRAIERLPKRDAALRDRLALLLMHDSMLRVGEACAIELRDFSRDRKWLTVRGEIAKWREPGEDQRVPVTDRTIEALAEWLAVRGRRHGPVLLTGSGKPVNRYHYNNLLARLGERHLGRHVHPHNLRHEGITLLVCDAKLPLPIAKEAARHKSVVTTDRYLSVRPGWADDVRQAFG